MRWCGAAEQIELVDSTPGGAAPPDGPRQHLRARQGRRRARQLLPHRQPHGPARARAAVGGRPRRRVAPGLPRAPRHRGAVGDARARRGGRHRRARQRQPDPSGGAHRGPRQGRAHRHPRAGRRRARQPVGGTLDDQRQLARGARRHATARWSAPTSPRRSSGAARTEGATQLVLGASRRSRWDEITRGLDHRRDHPRVGPALDVHVISANEEGDPSASRCRRSGCGSPRCRGAASWPAG